MSWCLFCPVVPPDCFYPAVGLDHGLCRVCTPGNPAGGCPVRCQETLTVLAVGLPAKKKETNDGTKGDLIQKLFLRVVVFSLTLKVVLPQPDPWPASSVPRGRLAPAPGVNPAAAGTGDRRRNRLPLHLVEVGSEHVVLHRLWRERRIQLLILANLACLTNSCHFIVELRPWE